VTLPAQGSGAIDVVIDVPGGQNPAPGTFTRRVDLEFFETGRGRQTLLTVSLPINVAVEAYALLSFSRLSGNSGRAIVDFGFMRPNDTRDLGLTVSGNADYRLSFSSLNGGRLLHERDRTVFVPYFVSFDGRALDLASTETLSLERTGRFPVNRHRLLFSLPTAFDAKAGNYSDTVTVEVYPER
jgi:hypothetical protein